MKTLLIAVIFLMSGRCSAQHIRVVEPNGDSVTYVREAPRTVVRHVHDTVTVRDTVIAYYESRNESREVAQPMLIQPIVQPTIIVQRDTTPPVKDFSSIGIFGYTDFRGSAIAPAAQILFGSFHVWLYAGAYYTSVDHRATWTAGISGFAPIIHF